jgi:hypothetical protein
MNATFVVFAVISLSCAWAVAGEPPASNERLCPSTLVEAKVIDVGGTLTRQDATLLVTEVFCGMHSAKDKTFSISGPRSGESNNGSPSMLPPYEVGEVQIWMVMRDTRDSNRWVADIATPNYMGEGLGYISLPARKAVERTHYPETLAWARAVQTAAKAPADEQRKLLEHYAGGDVRQIRLWARSVLGSNKPAASTTQPSTRPNVPRTQSSAPSTRSGQ